MGTTSRRRGLGFGTILQERRTNTATGKKGSPTTTTTKTVLLLSRNGTDSGTMPSAPINIHLYARQQENHHRGRTTTILLPLKERAKPKNLKAKEQERNPKVKAKPKNLKVKPRNPKAKVKPRNPMASKCM